MLIWGVGPGLVAAASRFELQGSLERPVRLCGFLPRPLIRLGLVSCGVWQLCVLGLGWVLFPGDEKGAGLTLGFALLFCA